ncbi:ArsJ-associated glyceraldehyde-3-phosphate dehydrogenase [Shimia thalassica]|uniref:ArsJ-associated glyceraldehyde-3-phosphate dehydrogenase n=1 Tax=Shimia thalassica TaxID=1715693 RepID=UPI000C08BBCE|nr:ArsJ-associated glyceraldehyde-3-phosphate dehydrogenase [Shimia thalassica]PHO05124.1 type I glyceraldehyde-3-phosphate dehydrogenase [Rhodobacteraceae bacterium 4F10]MBU2942505.1 ArsJ-associated glyceraldehyde-3-phosphate dehydrogenase [Shimia thalassica]MDO6485530.1 ArsJ-associated glyceraldehyde-3-phosphate dehydrogenase [Shimia thalassica]MDO6504434.1 ArsJ-associated glyceraldehyde-3-phosphate dehydrogenase [Shimia thalassica]MDP2519645.1 ArsJ-associated glyceraldehyde-3-phosphate dehy
MTKIAINGLGRMGKLVIRSFFDLGLDAEIVLLNDGEGDAEIHAHLLEFDTVHGRWRADFAFDDDSITIDGHKMRFTSTRDLKDLPLEELGVDLVVDCTGAFKTNAKLQPYFDAGVKKIVVSAPVKEDDAANIVYGVNSDIYDADTHKVVTAASCTTNCIAPIVQVIREHLGIEQASFTTIHDVTNTQTIVDRVHKDPRRARSALNSLIPTTTGSAKAIIQIFPDLDGKIDGHAVRVPLLNASLTDIVFNVSRETTAEEVNKLLEQASLNDLEGILGYETRPLVSCDYTNDDRSTIVDAMSTRVIGGTHVKIYAWYDNEWGYAWRLADVTRMVVASL